jgi:hypothetical protein
VRILAAAACSVALLLVPLAAGATFGRTAEIPLVKQPVKVLIGDATQDGVQDVVLANATAPSMSILPGRGDGSFEKPLEHPEAAGARAFVFGDFNGDGADELAVATPTAIQIYAGVDGNLTRQHTYPVQGATSLTTGDFDGDGNLDLVATSATQAVVFVLHGVGDGTFDPPTQVAIGSPATATVVADFNNDSAPDIAAAGAGLSILYGNGDGTFAPYQAIPGPKGLRAIAAEDLDSDSFTDLVVTGGLNQVFVLMNDGQGGFPTATPYKVGGTPVGLALDDLDVDGTADIVTVNRGTNDISILLGNGDGTFHPATRVKVGRTPTALSVGDLNGEGRTDLVVANAKSKSITVLMNGIDAPQPIVCLVPRVARKTFAVAKGIVTSAHCAVAPIHRVYSNRVRRGRVIAQSPVPGVRAPEGTLVTLVVSRGPKR